jgi:hypothetical protein
LIDDVFKMPPRDSVIVNKIPSPRSYVDHPQSFNRFEQLYLELIENKNKIKQNLVNKDYVPTLSNLATANPSGSESHFAGSPSTSDDSVEKFKLTKYTPESRHSQVSRDSERIEKLEQLTRDEDDNHSVKSEPPPSIHSVHSTHSGQSGKNEKNARNASMSLSNKLQEILNKNSTAGGSKPSYQDKYSTQTAEDNRFDEYQKSRKRLPTLSELEEQGAVVRKEMADASRLSIEDEDLKREMLFKFDLLRKSYKDQNIPTFTIHSDYKMMCRSYEDTVRRLSLDSSVETYKRYLIGAFMLIEYSFGRWLKFDMKGYTQQQIVGMSSYEKLLIEIGEKAYMPEGEQWPVEVRLIFLMVINTAFFLIGKMILNKTGANLMGAINNMNTANPAPEQAPKRKMQGPSINIDDLPDVGDL